MKAITTAALIAVALLLAGCNTVRGFGQDLQKVGDKIEEKAKN
jgi:entericidin A